MAYPDFVFVCGHRSMGSVDGTQTAERKRVGVKCPYPDSGEWKNSLIISAD